MLKPVTEAEKCSECQFLINDNGVNRCKLFDNAIIEDTSEKQCKDSI